MYAPLSNVYMYGQYEVKCLTEYHGEKVWRHFRLLTIYIIYFLHTQLNMLNSQVCNSFTSKVHKKYEEE